MTKEKKQEFTLRITNANKTALIVILYDMILKYLEDAENAIQNKERRRFHKEMARAKACVKELVGSLYLEHEIAIRMLELYGYVTRQLTMGQMKFQTTEIENVRIVIKGLAEAYREIEKLDTTPPVMGHVQSVYAGLTYGKTSLSENVSGNESNRGFFV